MVNVEKDENTYGGKLFDVLPFFNFVLSFLIVMHHSFNINVDYNANVKSFSWVCERFFYNLSECAVPIFFFLSAMLFYRNYDGTIENYKKKLKKRVNSILVPYLIFNILGYIKHLLVSRDPFRVYNLARSIVFSDTMPLWFLRELFILVLLAPLICFLKKKLKLVVMLILLIITFIISGGISYRSFAYWFPIYFLGVLCKEKDVLSIVQWIQRKNLQYCLLAMVCIAAWILPNTVGSMDYLGNLIFYCFRIFSVLIGVLLLGTLMIKKPKIYWFMNYSFWVYCVHFPFISFITVIIRRITLGGNDFYTIQYFLTVVLVYIFSVLSGYIIKKFMPNIWNILNGCR